MKNLLSAGLFFVTTHAAAHPGHGKSGLFHFHEFSDGILMLVALVALGLLCWAWKK
jgi:hypothetical protein